MINDWRKHYSSAYQNIVSYCPGCGMETPHETPYCCNCGRKNIRETNEGQVAFTPAECGREK